VSFFQPPSKAFGRHRLEFFNQRRPWLVFGRHWLGFLWRASIRFFLADASRCYLFANISRNYFIYGQHSLGFFVDAGWNYFFVGANQGLLANVNHDYFFLPTLARDIFCWHQLEFFRSTSIGGIFWSASVRFFCCWCFSTDVDQNNLDRHWQKNPYLITTKK